MKKNWFLKIIWRLQFKKVAYIPVQNEGRCTHCDGGKSVGSDSYACECGIYYCPCKFREQLIRRYTFLK